MPGIRSTAHEARIFASAEALEQAPRPSIGLMPRRTAAIPISRRDRSPNIAVFLARASPTPPNTFSAVSAAFRRLFIISV